MHQVEDIGISPWPVNVVEFGADVYTHRKQVGIKQLYNQVQQTAWALRTNGWATHQNAKEVLLWSEELEVNMWQSVTVSNSPLTHKKHQPFWIKWEKYIFIKKCVRFVHWSHHYVSAYICMYMNLNTSITISLGGLGLWHINLYRLFNAKSYFYVYIKYMICKHILYIHIFKWSNSSISHNSIQHKSTKLNGSKYCYI